MTAAVRRPATSLKHTCAWRLRGAVGCSTVELLEPVQLRSAQKSFIARTFHPEIK